MPLPPLLLIAFASGLATTLVARHELRMSPRPLPLTRAFLAYVSYAVLVIVPVSAYFYVFHGDWFVLYLVDVNRIPSAIALLGFVGEAAIGGVGFLVGGVLVRNQREMVVGVLLGALVVAATVVTMLYTDRLGQVGNYMQFHRPYGLQPYTSGPVMTGGLVMGAFLVFGLTFLLVRLWMSSRQR